MCQLCGYTNCVPLERKAGGLTPRCQEMRPVIKSRVRGLADRYNPKVEMECTAGAGVDSPVVSFPYLR